MKITQFHVKNQFVASGDNGNTFLQSYNSVIVKRDKNGSVTLDQRFWDYSKTTGRYRNLFLNETKKETEQKIEAGIYKLADLNS